MTLPNSEPSIENWDDAEYWLSSQRVPASLVTKLAEGNYPWEAFSKGQIISKVWMLHTLINIRNVRNSLTMTWPGLKIALLGCWIALPVEELLSEFFVDRIYGFDIDPEAIRLAEQFNEIRVRDEWKFKGVVADVTTLNTKDMLFETGGELINFCPDLIINTSAEHMDDTWFETADEKQLIVVQSNNDPNLEGHINTCASFEEFDKKYPMRDAVAQGTLTLPNYTRFMKIGFK